MPTTQQTSELAAAIGRYLAELGRENASPHTIRNYASDLEQLLAYFSPPGATPPRFLKSKFLCSREWLDKFVRSRAGRRFRFAEN